MIYLDYAADTPVNQEVLQTFNEISNDYIGNPNSPHALGRMANARLHQATEHIAQLFNTKVNEIIYTSGASESNNLAIKGVAEKYKKYGRHIVTSYLEHSSVNGAMGYLKNQGFEIDYVEILSNGQIDINHLKELLRPDTILVSIGYVDSEIGIRQPVKEITALLAAHPHCCFHSDATQAVGKIPVSFEGIDLITFAPHKFYGLNGIGLLIKKEEIQLEPQIHGGISTTPYRSGTPALALIAAAEKALEIAFLRLDEQYAYITVLNQKLHRALAKYPGIRINSTVNAIPHILNISIPGIRTEAIQHALGEQDIYVATKSACCAPNTVSRPVYALTKDKKAALSTLRISLSHLTTQDELEEFIRVFDRCYNQYK